MSAGGNVLGENFNGGNVLGGKKSPGQLMRGKCPQGKSLFTGPNNIRKRKKIVCRNKNAMETPSLLELGHFFSQILYF
jgi:hypothetical protein